MRKPFGKLLFVIVCFFVCSICYSQIDISALTRESSTSSISNGPTIDVESGLNNTGQSRMGRVEGVINRLNVRIAPWGRIIGTLNKNDIVEITGGNPRRFMSYTYGWLEINYHGQTGFVWAGYINEISAPSNLDESFPQTGYVTATMLNLRSSVWGTVVGAMPLGSTVEILERKDGWCRVNYNNRSGWAHENYISNSSPSGNTGTANSGGTPFNNPGNSGNPDAGGITTENSNNSGNLESSGNSVNPQRPPVVSDNDDSETPQYTLRRLRNNEVTTDIGVNAKRILKENFDKPYGTEIPFESGGKRFVGRIEKHYHEPGGPAKPWGWHKGVSVLAIVEE